MNITYHNPQFQTKSQWNDIIKHSGIDVDVPVYLVECRRPQQGHAYLSSWIQSELSAISDKIKQQANAKEILIVFHIYEWVNVDHNECLKLFLPILNLNAIRVIVPCIPQPASSWVRHFPSFWMGYRNRIKDSTNVKEVSLHRRNKKFTCLNGSPRPHRLYAVSKLLSADLLDDGYVSLTKMKDHLLVLESQWGKIIHQFTTSQSLIDELLSTIDIQEIKKILPLQPDDLTVSEQNNHSRIQTQFYNDSYWNIITETFNHNVVSGFLTEKTFKPIANLQPFVIIGTYSSLCILKELGFKTFGDYIDESYDDIADETERLKSSISVALDLARMSHNDHIKLMAKVKPILEHNQQLFYSDKALKKYLIEALQ